METILVIASILVVLGIIGSIIPALPGPLLSFIGLLLLFFGKQGSVPLASLLTFGFIMVLLLVVNYILPVYGARFSGASKKGQWGAVIGALIGIIFFPPLGIFLGALIGAVLGEMQDGKKFRDSMKAGVGVMAGGLAAIFLQTVFAITVAIYFFIKLF